MAGLDPAISLRWAPYVHKRDRRVKPGDDREPAYAASVFGTAFGL
jgi:hypothetical protein